MLLLQSQGPYNHYKQVHCVWMLVHYCMPQKQKLIIMFNDSTQRTKHGHQLSPPPGGEKAAWHESINTTETSFPPFVPPHLLHQCYNTEWMFVSVKRGHRMSVMQMQGLLNKVAWGLSGPINHSENTTHIPVASPGTSLPLLYQPRAGVTLPAFNTSSWLRFGWHVATGLTHTRRVFCSLMKHQLAANLHVKLWLCLCVCVWRKTMERILVRTANRGNKHWGPCFSLSLSSHLFHSLLFLIFSLPLLILVWLFLELLFNWTSKKQAIRWFSTKCSTAPLSIIFHHSSKLFKQPKTYHLIEEKHEECEHFMLNNVPLSPSNCHFFFTMHPRPLGSAVEEKDEEMGEAKGFRGCLVLKEACRSLSRHIQPSASPLNETHNKASSVCVVSSSIHDPHRKHSPSFSNPPSHSHPHPYPSNQLFQSEAGYLLWIAVLNLLLPHDQEVGMYLAARLVCMFARLITFSG